MHITVQNIEVKTRIQMLAQVLVYIWFFLFFLLRRLKSLQNVNQKSGSFISFPCRSKAVSRYGSLDEEVFNERSGEPQTEDCVRLTDYFQWFLQVFHFTKKLRGVLLSFGETSCLYNMQYGSTLSVIKYDVQNIHYNTEFIKTSSSFPSVRHIILQCWQLYSFEFVF